MFGPIRNIIFDFDGTLIDSMPSAVCDIKKIISNYSDKEIDEELFNQTLGKSPQEFFARFVPKQKHEQSVEDWFSINAAATSETRPLFDGVDLLLNFLKKNSEKYGVAIFTGRDRKSAEHFVSLHEPLKALFNADNIRCGDDEFKPKPSGEAIFDLLKVNQWKPNETLCVGDHPHDASAAREAGIKFAAALWDGFFSEGKTSRAKFRTSWSRWDGIDIDLKLNTPENLIHWLKNDQT